MRAGKIFLVWFLIIVAFIAGSLLIICYTSGYKINWRVGKIEKTGMIYLASQPRDVEVYFDGKLKSLGTPVSFRFLLPGSHYVMIKKQGLVGWEKNLKVEPGMVTKEDNIILFKANPDLSNLETDVVSEFKLAPDRKTVGYLNSSGLWIINLDSKEKWQLITRPTDQNINLIGFSDNSQKILIKVGGDFWVVNVGGKKLATTADIFRLSSIIPIQFSAVSWRPQDNDKIFGLATNILYLIDISNLSLKIVDQSVATYSASPDTIYYFKIEEGNQELMSAYLDGNSVTKIKEKIGQNPAKLLASYDNQLVMIDQNQDLFYFDDNKTKLTLLGSGALDAFWGRDEGGFFNFFSTSRLLFNTKNEIWWYTKEKKAPAQLVTRLSTEITKAIYYSDQEHIVFLTDGKLYVAEQDGKNSVQIGSAQLSEFNLLNRGKTILSAGKDGLVSALIRQD